MRDIRKRLKLLERRAAPPAQREIEIRPDGTTLIKWGGWPLAILAPGLWDEL